MTKKIKLTQNKFALVDEEDFDYLNKFKWCVNNNGYAVRVKDKITIRMHRVIIKAKKGKLVDHINRNKLDNRKSNLRITTKSINAFNSKLYSTNKSGYRGVHWNKRINKWVAEIMVNGQNIILGSFTNKKKAANTRKIYEAFVYT